MDFWKFPWDPDPGPAVIPPSPELGPLAPKPRGRRPGSVARSLATTNRTAPDWLFHHLTLSGPAEGVDKFAVAARGSGVIPWQLDFADVEETVFHLAISQPTGHRHLTIEGCRILARQFRDRVEARQARAMALVGRSVACPFDLHTLLPVPAAVLQLGPTHPTALAWLAAHWGTSDGLRQVVVRDKPTAGRRLPRTHTVVGYGFFTSGDTPLAAIETIAPCWPALRFVLQPRPAD